MQFLFVGEQPSKTARRMKVSWTDGRLCAKQLFDALRACGVEPARQSFLNLFRGTRVNRRALAEIKAAQLPVVGMGRKVQSCLVSHGVPHIPLVHPAARGSIRRKDRYVAHVRRSLRA